MNLKDSTKTTKNSLSFISLRLGTVAVAAGLLFTVFSNHHRQYSAGDLGVKESEAEHDAGAQGMMSYFFNARKNITTNALDYPSMLAAAEADRAALNARNTHNTSALPNFSWVSAGPTNIGGRTRAILIDKNDPSHQTIFAGGMTGGVWKSTDGGSHWGNTFSTVSFSQDENMLNMNICCIAQDANGAIYVGTGEGFTASLPEFSSGELGGGIFKSTDDGNTWRLLPSTKPTANLNNVTWAYTNRIAINPTNPMVIYAATGNVGANGGGLYISHDSGATWALCINSTNSKTLSQRSLDVKISSDGSVVVAEDGGAGFICYPQSGPDNSFTPIHTTGAGKLPNGGSRIEFAVAPTDPNRIYASYIQSNGSFGGAGSKSGIFMTKTALTNQGYWYEIGPGGSMAFDPYAEPATVQDQATYDNALAVSSGNAGTVLAGGTVLYQWSSLYNGDTVGTWTELSGYFRPIHPDEHTIVFDNNNPNIIFLGCDGGIYKSVNAGVNWLAYNRNYNVTQYYTVCYSPMVNYDTVNYGNGTLVEGLGIGGGTQDNGSPYVNGNGYYKNDATDLSGGDGAGAAVSQLNPYIAYFCSDYGSLLKEGNLISFSQPTTAYTKTVGVNRGANIDSIATVCNQQYLSCFVFPVALYENYYDTLNHDSVLFIAQKNYGKDSLIWVIGANGNFPYVLTSAHNAGDTFNVPDRVVSKLAVGFDAAHGIWINGQGASNSTVVWIPVAGPLSKPTALTGGSIHALAWSPDGDAIFSGDESGNIFRFTNLNAVIANDYASGALWYSEGGSHPTGLTTVVSTKITLSSASGRDVLSINFDPKNHDNLLITLGNYGGSSTHYVYLSTNAITAGTPTFTDEQGNLPPMPVYGAILDIRNSDGTYLPGSAMVATEHGIYYTDKLNGGSTVWTKASNGFPANVLTQAIKQQTMPNWMCNNAGDIYVGTHGRGLWISSDMYQAPTAVPSITSASSLEKLSIYPNPMNSTGNINFDLSSADNITISIYNIQGKEVKAMELGKQAPGNHVIPFSVTDLQAGTYFAAVTGSNFRKVAKFVVVK